MKMLLQPLPVRIFHWIMFFCIMLLLLSGLYLNHPPAEIRLKVSLMRKIQLYFGFLLLLNLSGQIYYYAVTRTYAEVLFLPRDLVNLRSFARYVLFITDNHPNFGRYNPGQKLLFTLWGLAVLLAGITGIVLVFPDNTLLIQRFVGGLQNLRLVHFGIAAFFAMSIPLHLYLVFTESPVKLQAIFTGYVETGSGKQENTGSSKKL